MQNRLLIPKEGSMRTHVVVYGNKPILDAIEPSAIQQLKNAACLPGVIAVLGMPDLHVGYGLPIGGVMVQDAEAGVISPGAVGVDINCGVRVFKTPLNVNEVQPRAKEIIHNLLRWITTGVGGKSSNELQDINRSDFVRLIEGGVGRLKEMGFATEDDVLHTEEKGQLKPVSSEAVDETAITRGKKQIGTLGSGNHFLEIQKVVEIYDRTPDVDFELEKDQVLVMIHSGSRGFGEQICSDYVKKILSAQREWKIDLPTKELAAAPISSHLGMEYFKAMAASANFAWVNRQMMMFEIRKVLSQMFSMHPNEFQLIYDVAHNIAKFEEYRGRKVLVHRKGATRAFPQHPALIPGSMGTPSFIVQGTEKVMQETYGTICHGSGRRMSRTQALGKGSRKAMVSQEDFLKATRNVLVVSGSGEDLRDEAPQVYKNILDVISSLEEVGLVKKLVRLEPLAVIKG